MGSSPAFSVFITNKTINMILLLLWLPFQNFIFGIFFSRLFGKNIIYYISFNIILTFLLSLFLLFQCYYFQKFYVLNISTWFLTGYFINFWGIYLDIFIVFMVAVVTLISSLVHIYSIEYMRYDPFLSRFMCYLSLFTFFMLILIISDNFLQMFVGWEGVGLCSYLLINFWHSRLQANKAAIKAMLYNRFTDFLLLIALFCIFSVFGSFDYAIIFSLAPFFDNTKNIFLNFAFLNIIDLICIFLFFGAMGKSAQLGFHNWLPDAMEGPTPVSALIHAATMVTAGVFLILKCSILFELSKISLHFIALIGSLTALFGATVGLYPHDLKKVIAFSTCSQLGYMIMACGLNCYNAAFFHLVTHAFFKALLFLAAGSIIHAASNEQDIRKYGNFLRYLPITYTAFTIGSLNLIGLPFLSGFYSKDILLEAIFVANLNISLFCYILGITAIFFTASYSTRLFILIFIKKSSRVKYFINNVHESSIEIKISLIILSSLSIVFGYFTFDMFNGLGNTFFSNIFCYNRSQYFFSDIEFISKFFKFLPFIITGFGIISSFIFYFINSNLLNNFKYTKFFKYIYRFFIKKWFFDRIFTEFFFLPFLLFGYSYTYKKLDRGLLEFFGPFNFVKSISSFVLKKNKPLFNYFIYNFFF